MWMLATAMAVYGLLGTAIVITLHSVGEYDVDHEDGGGAFILGAILWPVLLELVIQDRFNK